MDSKDTVKKQWTNKDGTITWRQYNQLPNTAEILAGPHVHVHPDSHSQVPASNAVVDNTVPLVTPIHTIIRKEVAKAVAHLVAEIDGLTQRCEELEVELISRADLAEYPVLGSEGDQ